jgi:hypothetical protein
VPLLHRINAFFGTARKSLISLKSSSCRESVQAVANRDAASVSTRRGVVLHKVTHSDSGEFQKPHQIMDLQALVEVMRRHFVALLMKA